MLLIPRCDHLAHHGTRVDATDGVTITCPPEKSKHESPKMLGSALFPVSCNLISIKGAQFICCQSAWGSDSLIPAIVENTCTVHDSHTALLQDVQYTFVQFQVLL